MNERAIVVTVSCFVLAGALAFLIFCTVGYFQKYNDAKQSYNDGYNTALEDKTAYELQITNLNNDKASLSNQIEQLNIKKTADEQTINNLTEKKQELQTQVTTLTTENEQNLIEITRLTTLKNELQKQLTNIDNSNIENLAIINSLNSQISILNNQISTLSTANSNNVSTIANLNAEIALLNTQITTLSATVVEQSNKITVLNAQIVKLNNYIAVYEQFLQGFESEVQSVVTFEYDGTLYNIQLVQNGTTINITDPISTDYIIFNGWTVNGQAVNLDTYTINKNTKFIASVIYKYDVNFIASDVIVNSQIIEKNSFAIVPSNPIKQGYVFEGWTIDGVNIVDVSAYVISSNTTFIAKYKQLHSVQFLDGETVISSQTITNGDFASNISRESTAYKIFNGWTVNDVIVDVATYPITSDTTFIASYTYKYDVTFLANEQTLDTQLVTQNTCAIAPIAPLVDDKIFCGYSLDGYNVVDVSTYCITENTTFIAAYGHKWAGIWSGNDTNNRYTMTLKVSDSGVACLTLDLLDKNFVNEPIIYIYKSSEQCWLFSITGSIEFYAYEENNTFRFVCSNPSITFILTKTTNRFEQSYIVSFEKQYAGKDFSGNSVNYDITFDGYSLTIGGFISSNYKYFLYDNKIYYYTGGFNNFGVIADFELTDSYLTIGDTTYTFI